ncbi:MAG: DUF2520 domain-containing protein [Bacillota bacterium]|nr:DUF2520 domain-containing protein [Bacillota bacterium]
MKIGFIGAGKVGFSLGKYFSINNLELSGYYSRNHNSAVEASKFTDSTSFFNLEDLIRESDLIFITTPDDKIKHIWQEINNFDIRDKIICHASGSLSSKVFSNISNSGAFGYSIHPIFPVSDKYTCYQGLKNAYFSIEGDSKHLTLLRHLMGSLGNNTLILNSDNKALYHLSCVTVSNLVLSLINKGCNYLEQYGVDSLDSLNALMPLIEYNISNLREKGFVNALTGPIERADTKTIENHLNSLDKDKALYKSLSYNLVHIAKMKNSEKDYSKILELLNDQTSK